jgi:hypothetical protein
MSQKEIPITEGQWAIYASVQRDFISAKSRMELAVNMMLAGHGITEGDVKEILPDKIILEQETKTDG